MKVQMRQFYLPNDLLQSLKVLMIHAMNVVKIVAIKSKEMYLAPSHVSQRLFGCDKRLE